jgi:hypothetical protein
VKSDVEWTNERVNDHTENQTDPIPFPKVKSSASRVGEFVSKSFGASLVILRSKRSLREQRRHLMKWIRSLVMSH